MRRLKLRAHAQRQLDPEPVEPRLVEAERILRAAIAGARRLGVRVLARRTAVGDFRTGRLSGCCALTAVAMRLDERRGVPKGWEDASPLDAEKRLGASTSELAAFFRGWDGNPARAGDPAPFHALGLRLRAELTPDDAS